MAKTRKPSMLSLLDLLAHLTPYSEHSLEDLAKATGKDLDSLRADLEMLSALIPYQEEASIVIEDDLVITGPLSSLTQTSLTPHQMTALMLMLRMVGVPKDSDLIRKLRSADAKKWDEEFFEKHVFFSNPVPDFDIFIELSLCFKNSIPAHITYRSRSGEVTTRTVDVARLLLEREGWYIAGYCHNSKEIRTFRVSEISSAEMALDKKTLASKNEGVPDSIGEMVFDPDAEVELVKLRFANRFHYVSREWPHARSVKDRTTGEREILIPIVSRDWLANKVIALGGKVQVIHPESVRKFVHEAAEKKYAYYSNSNLGEL